MSIKLSKIIGYFKSVSGFHGVAMISPKGKVVDHNLPIQELALKTLLKQIDTVIKAYPKHEQSTASLSMDVEPYLAFYHPVPSGSFLFFLQGEEGMEKLQYKIRRIIEETKTSAPAFKKESGVKTPLTSFKNSVAPVATASSSAAPVLGKTQVPKPPVLQKAPVGQRPASNLSVPSQATVPAPKKPMAMEPVKAPLPSEVKPVLRTKAMQPTAAIKVDDASVAAAPVESPTEEASSEDSTQEIHTQVLGDDNATLIKSLQDGFEVYGSYQREDGKTVVQLRKVLP